MPQSGGEVLMADAERSDSRRPREVERATVW